MNRWVRRQEAMGPGPESFGARSTRTDSSLAARWGIPGWSRSSRASGNVNPPAICGRSHGGGRTGGCDAPESPHPSLSPAPETASSSGMANPIARPDALAGARTGAVVGRPRCRRIFPTTSGSERNARTTRGTVWLREEHLGHARPSTWSTRRSNWAQESLRRGAVDGDPLDPLAPVSAGFSSSGEMVISSACREGGGGGSRLRNLLRFARTPWYRVWLV